MKKVTISQSEIRNFVTEGLKGFGDAANCNVDLVIFSDGTKELSVYTGNQSTGTNSKAFTICEEGEDFVGDMSEEDAKEYYPESVDSEGEVNWEKVAEGERDANFWDYVNGLTEDIVNRGVADGEDGFEIEIIN